MKPDRLTTLPFERGLSLAWDIRVPHPLAPSHVRSAATFSGAMASEAESIKQVKYPFLSGRVLFEPFAVETHGAFGPAAKWLVGRLAHRSRDVGFARSRLAIARALLVALLEGNDRCAVEAYTRATLSAQHTNYFWARIFSFFIFFTQQNK